MIEADILPRHPALLTTARAVHEQGIELAWDGFGPASLASLSALRPDTQPEALADLTDLLRPLPFAELKLDCGLVDGRTQAFVNTALRLGRNLGRRVVAHKVEHEAQQQFLVEHGCQYLQGHRIARPLPARALERWLAAQGIWPILATR